MSVCFLLQVSNIHVICLLVLVAKASYVRFKTPTYHRVWFCLLYVFEFVLISASLLVIKNVSVVRVRSHQWWTAGTWQRYQCSWWHEKASYFSAYSVSGVQNYSFAEGNEGMIIIMNELLVSFQLVMFLNVLDQSKFVLFTPVLSCFFYLNRENSLVTSAEEQRCTWNNSLYSRWIQRLFSCHLIVSDVNNVSLACLFVGMYDKLMI